MKRLKTSEKIEMLMRKNNIDIQDTEIFEYGLSLLVNYTVTALAILTVSIYFKITLDILVFCTSFLILRSSTGGYHAESRFLCFLFSLAVTVLIPLALNRVPTSLNLLILVNVVMFCLLMENLPVENEDRPLSESEKTYHKKRSIVLYLVGFLVLFVLSLFDITHITTVMAAGMITNSLSVILAIIQKKFVLA